MQPRAMKVSALGELARAAHEEERRLTWHAAEKRREEAEDRRAVVLGCRGELMQGAEGEPAQG